MTKRIWTIGLISLALALSACGKTATTAAAKPADKPPAEQKKPTIPGTPAAQIGRLQIDVILDPDPRAEKNVRYKGTFFLHSDKDETPVDLKDAVVGGDVAPAKMGIKLQNEGDPSFLEPPATLTQSKTDAKKLATETDVQAKAADVFKPFTFQLDVQGTDKIQDSFKLSSVVAVPQALFAGGSTIDLVSKAEVVISKSKGLVSPTKIWVGPKSADTKAANAYGQEECKIVVKGKVDVFLKMDWTNEKPSMPVDAATNPAVAGLTKDSNGGSFLLCSYGIAATSSSPVEIIARVQTPIFKLTVTD
jgi:hypothetical protein